MSNIRRYLRSRQTVKERDEYEKKIAEHRKKIRIAVLIAVLLIIVILLVVKIYIDNRSFETYEVSGVIEMNNDGNGHYYAFGNGMLAYSDDGISYIKDGETIWNQAFEMKNPIVDTCGEMMAICDEQKTTVYIYDIEGQQGKIETVYPVIDMEVSEQGVIAAITQDAETNRIEIFDKEGNSIAVGQTYVTGEGCPIDISISNDGTKLVASYIYVDGGESKCKVVFYNYSEIGKNEVGRIVGGFNHYEDTIVAKVEFIDNDTVVAYGENLFTIYSMKEKPEMLQEIEQSDKIKSIFYNESHIGLVLETEEYDNPFTIKVYDTDGDEEFSQSTNFLYSGIEIMEDSIVLYNETEMKLMTASGRERFAGMIDEGIKKIIPTEESDEYYIINYEHNIMSVTLK